jgi:hypothetical protein
MPFFILTLRRAIRERKKGGERGGKGIDMGSLSRVGTHSIMM